jgi:hypothetical protein
MWAPGLKLNKEIFIDGYIQSQIFCTISLFSLRTTKKRSAFLRRVLMRPSGLIRSSIAHRTVSLPFFRFAMLTAYLAAIFLRAAMVYEYRASLKANRNAAVMTL